MRAELDALVTRFEAQLKQHVSHTAGARREELDALEQWQVTASPRASSSPRPPPPRSSPSSTAPAPRPPKRAAANQQLAAANQQLASANERLAADLARAEAEVARLTASLRDVGPAPLPLDEQFVAERSYVEALTRAGGTLLFDVAQLTWAVAGGPPLGVLRRPQAPASSTPPSRPSCASAGAPSRATRSPPSNRSPSPQRPSRRAASSITVAAGQRFTSATMERPGRARSPPRRTTPSGA